MTTPNLPQLNPGGQMTHNIPPTLATSPFLDLWFTASNVTDVDREMMGWLTAQGWQVVGVTYDNSTSPPTPKYSMSKQSMNNWIILQDLMFSLTVAYNDGREMNYLRYKDIINVWNNAFLQSEQYYQDMTAKSNADVLVFFTAFTNDTQTILTELGLARSEAVAESDRVATQLDAYITKLDDIEVNYQNHAVAISALLTRQTDYLSTYLLDYQARLDTLDAEYLTHVGRLDDLLASMTSDLASHITSQLASLDKLLTDYTAHAAAVNALKTSAEGVLTTHAAQIDALLTAMLSDYYDLSSSSTTALYQLELTFGTHSASYETILAALTADFTAHASTVRGLLTGLGTTELARINEAFDARLAEVSQNLMNRGFYSSPLLNDDQDRVTRERSQAIGELNDRLAREKVANEHNLFGEQDKMRGRTLDGRDRLYGLKQDLLRYEAQHAHQLFAQLQGVRERTVAGKQTVYGFKEQFTRFQVDVAANLETRLEQVRTRTMDSVDRVQVLRAALSGAKLQNSSQIYTELSAIRRQDIEETVHTHAAKQDVSRNEESQRDKLLAQLNDAVAAVLDGKQKYSAMSLQKGQYLLDLRTKLNVQMMEIAARRLQMRQGTSQAELELMKYQVDSRNNFLVGMFKVIQDRTDEYPDLNEISKLAFSLGDAGSGWVAP